ncbi:MAG: sigma factor-like helix-turn-helix DNA-binding protein, partial [Phyllobacterium sp.]|uniref:sigma factor-like helix-turn-helix DNA-binding protein n=1 Tax=Phyllobacterium sp. TaxID=1871046 RepID=UPI0030F01937
MDVGQPDTKISRMRMRAAWMYYIEQMTQNEIAEILGVGRVTIVRMLAEARARNEVK